MIKLLIFSIVLPGWAFYKAYSTPQDCHMAGLTILNKYPAIIQYECCNPDRPACEQIRQEMDLEFGVSNMGMDWDNPIKPFQDCLQKRYGFDDRRIEAANVKKVKVAKGSEFIGFTIRALCKEAGV